MRVGRSLKEKVLCYLNICQRILETVRNFQLCQYITSWNWCAFAFQKLFFGCSFTVYCVNITYFFVCRVIFQA